MDVSCHVNGHSSAFLSVISSRSCCSRLFPNFFFQHGKAICNLLKHFVEAYGAPLMALRSIAVCSHSYSYLVSRSLSRQLKCSRGSAIKLFVVISSLLVPTFHRQPRTAKVLFRLTCRQSKWTVICLAHLALIGHASQKIECKTPFESLRTNIFACAGVVFE